MTISYRLFQKTDMPALVQMANAIDAQESDPGRTSLEPFEQLISAPHIHAEEDFFVALGEDDALIGVSLLMVRPDSGMAFADIMVHPDHHDGPAAANLIRRSEARVLARASTEFADAPAVYLNFGVLERKKFLASILQTLGYSEVRRAYMMRIALNSPLAQPEFPADFALRPFDKGRDAKNVHAVFQECFADHWGGVAQITFEEWAYQMESPTFDPGLWHILSQNDEIAAICLCEVSTREEGLGLVEALGVRPAFRKQGLGGLLLRHAFCDFQKRGYQQVGLDVDTENTTQAVALYEKAGMSVYRCTIYYHKVLRGSLETVKE
jgi:mycothiol synthase